MCRESSALTSGKGLLVRVNFKSLNLLPYNVVKRNRGSRVIDEGTILQVFWFWTAA